jgi:hypothetical protein
LPAAVKARSISERARPVAYGCSIAVLMGWSPEGFVDAVHNKPACVDAVH